MPRNVAFGGDPRLRGALPTGDIRPVGSASIRFRAERPPRGGRASDDARISGLASRVILVDPQGSEGTGEAQHENAGSRYGDQVN